jgi:hypothetical protein
VTATNAAPSELYIVLPAGTASDGLLRAPLSAILARWPTSYAPVVRAAVERRPPSGIVNYGGEVYVTKWHARHLAGLAASVMRGDARELIELADAEGAPR